MENSISKILEDAIKQLHTKIDEGVDQEFVKELQPLMERLQDKHDRGTLDLQDFGDLLRIYRNVVIPEIKKQSVSRLKAIKDMIEVSQ